jgi:hypothetical protein
VEVSNRKGIANQTGPESCVVHREVRDEALAGEPAHVLGLHKGSCETGIIRSSRITGSRA